MTIHALTATVQPDPMDAERQPLLDVHRRALEDMMWAMLTSKEFLFNY